MITLAVVNYNTRDKLARLISTLFNSVSKTDTRNWQLVVADNGSTDGSVELLQQYEPLLDGVYYNDNIGYARACNQIGSRHPNEIMGFLNGDVWLTTRNVNDIEKAFQGVPSMGILGPKQRDEQGYIRHGGIFGQPNWLHPINRGWSCLDTDDLQFRDCKPCLTVSGSAYFIRSSVAEQLYNCSVFRAQEPTAEYVFPEYKHFYEETQISYHAHAHGVEVWYWGAVSMGHSWHASSPIGNTYAQEGFVTGQKKFLDFLAAHECPITDYNKH